MTLLTPINYFFKYTNKILGSIAAMFLYPLKSILVNLGLVLLTLLFALVAIIVVPLIVTIIGTVVAEDLIGGLILGTIAFVITALILVPATIFSLSVILVAGIIDLFKSIFFGATDGFEKGLFFGVLKTFIIEFSLFSTLARFSIDLVNTENQEMLQEVPADADEEEDNGEYGFVLTEEQFIHVLTLLAQHQQEPQTTYQDVDINDHEQPPAVPYVNERPEFALSAEEIQQAKSSSDATLKALGERYEELYQRLEKFELSLSQLDPDDDGSEAPASDLAGGMDEIRNPSEAALLVKQYLFKRDADGCEHWKVVPLTTRIAHRSDAQAWFDQGGKHPLTRDPILKPSPYEEQETRYKLVSYRNLNDSQELIEASMDIRQKLKLQAAPSQESSSGGVASIAETIKHRFLGGNNDAAQTLPLETVIVEGENQWGSESMYQQY